MVRKAEFDQLAGVVHLERALSSGKQLYPAWPQQIEPMELWFEEDVARLRMLQPELKQTLEELGRRGTTTAEATPGTDTQGGIRFA